MPDTGAGKSPALLFIDGERSSVAAIISQWIEEAVEDKQLKRCFRVKGDDRLPACFHTSNRQEIGI